MKFYDNGKEFSIKKKATLEKAIFSEESSDYGGRMVRADPWGDLSEARAYSRERLSRAAREWGRII